MQDEGENKKKSGKTGCFFKGIILLVVIFAIILTSIITLFSLASNFSKNLTFSNKPSTSKYKLIPAFYSGNANSKNKIVLINIKGVITDSDTSWVKSADPQIITNMLESAANDRHVKAVIININSPGGEITATDRIYHSIQIVRKHHKPVISVLGSIAASGGYYVAAGTDVIIANRLTITGSIGVIINSLKYYDLLKKIGVKDNVFQSGKMKDILNPARPATKEEEAIIQNLVTESYNEFVEIVSRGRIYRNKALTVDYIKNSIIGDGRIFSGKQALKLGLVDKLGYFNDSVEIAYKLSKLNKNDFQIITYNEDIGFSEFIKRLIYKNTTVNIAIPTIDRLCKIDSGRLYYLYPGWLQ